MIFTEKERKFIFEYYKGIGNEELAKLVNKKFNTSYTAMQITRFKDRHRLNSGINGKQLPIGSESKHNGYIIVKTGEPNKWEYKQRIIYKKAHGSIPDNQIIAFLDGDKTNCNIDNLVAVKNSEMGYLTGNRMYKLSKEITEVAINLAKLKEEVITFGSDDDVN